MNDIIIRNSSETSHLKMSDAQSDNFTIII